MRLRWGPPPGVTSRNPDQPGGEDARCMMRWTVGHNSMVMRMPPTVDRDESWARRAALRDPGDLPVARARGRCRPSRSGPHHPPEPEAGKGPVRAPPPALAASLRGGLVHPHRAPAPEGPAGREVGDALERHHPGPAPVYWGWAFVFLRVEGRDRDSHRDTSRSTQRTRWGTAIFWR